TIAALTAVDAWRARRDLARVAARTTLGEHRFASRQLPLILTEISCTARRVLEIVRIGRLEEEPRHVKGLVFCGFEVTRILPRVGNRDRRDLFSTDESIEVQQPLFTKRANVYVDAIQGAHHTDGVRAILENARSEDGIGSYVEFRQWSLLYVVVELTVVFASANKRFRTPAFGFHDSRPKHVHRVHRAWVVDVVGRDQRRVERSGTRSLEKLKDEVAWIGFPVKDPVDPEILCAHV